MTSGEGLLTFQRNINKGWQSTGHGAGNKLAVKITLLMLTFIEESSYPFMRPDKNMLFTLIVNLAKDFLGNVCFHETCEDGGY